VIIIDHGIAPSAGAAADQWRACLLNAPTRPIFFVKADFHFVAACLSDM
jgi:hypothetical protein